MFISLSPSFMSKSDRYKPSDKENFSRKRVKGFRKVSQHSSDGKSAVLCWTCDVVNIIAFQKPDKIAIKPYNEV